MSTITKKELIQIYTTKGFRFEEANTEIDFAIEILFGITSKDQLMGILPDTNDLKKLEEIVKRRVQTREPIAQIVGYSYFMGQKFEVTKDTLIPRPETELLVRKAAEIVKQNNFKFVLDIGTGSGCIACMIAKLTKAQVWGVDISNEALKIALNNAMHLDLMNKALFRKSDLFSKIREEEKFDIIVSNPPYIPQQEKDKLQIEVKDHEPHTALFTNDKKGIEFYEKIIKQAHKYLNPKGYIVFEIGINQANDVVELLKEHNYENIEVLKDVTNIERTICAKLKLSEKNS